MNSKPMFGHIRNHFGNLNQARMQEELALQEQLEFQRMFEEEMLRRQELMGQTPMGFSALGAMPFQQAVPEQPLGLLDIFRNRRTERKALQS